MDSKDILEKYVRSFRLECHFLLDAVNTKEMPIETYNRAYNNAKSEIIELLGLSDEEGSKIDALHRTFINKIVELEDYNLAEDYILKVINNL